MCGLSENGNRIVSPKISIIVPVYNAEKYLRRCLNSILTQTYTNFEVILVDDGSLDSSGEICDQYVGMDERVKAFHKKNEGVSIARNYGLDQAQGEWVTFSDSDDLLLSDAFIQYIQFVDVDIDLIMGGYESYDESNQLKNAVAYRGRHEITRHEAITQMFKPQYYDYQGYVWNKLFKRDIIQAFGIKFNESVYFNEDRLFVVEYLCNCSGKTVYFTNPVYKYYLRENSTMNSLNCSFNKKYVTDFCACEIMVSLIRKRSTFKNLILAKKELYLSFCSVRDLMIRFDSLDEQILVEMRRKLWRMMDLFTLVIIFLKKFFSFFSRCFV